MFDYSKRLNEIMTIHNMSGNKLAKLLSVDQTHISKILNAKGFPSYKLINDICDVFEISMNQFFNDSEGIDAPKLRPPVIEPSRNQLDNEIYEKLKSLDNKKKRVLNELIDYMK